MIIDHDKKVDQQQRCRKKMSGKRFSLETLNVFIIKLMNRMINNTYKEKAPI
jgi:hypothetical protein